MLIFSYCGKKSDYKPSGNANNAAVHDLRKNRERFIQEEG
jgi:hypothetical protein